MIFVTVGAQMPFDRMVRVVDEWAPEAGRTDVFAQIGETDWRPSHIEWSPFLTPDEFRRRVMEASVIIAHAGTGSILTALEYGKPILVMPRRGELQETRNDHQVATAMRFHEKKMSITVAFDEHEMRERLEAIDSLGAPQRIRTTASEPLINAIRSFIAERPA